MALSQIVLFDAIDLNQIPAGPVAVGAYVDGRWPTAEAAAARFPHAKILTIAISPAHDAEALDVETGDATPGDAPGWVRRQQARGIRRPVLYASVSVLQSQVIPALQSAGITRGEVRLWSAHYLGLHICGPQSCSELSTDADGCQWTNAAFGRALDQSLLVADFFAGAPVNLPTAPTAPPWQETMLAQLPELAEGAQDTPGTVEFVYRLRGWLATYGQITGIEPLASLPPGHVFDAATSAAVQQVQEHMHLDIDGKVQADEWSVLITGAA